MRCVVEETWMAACGDGGYDKNVQRMRWYSMGSVERERVGKVWRERWTQPGLYKEACGANRFDRSKELSAAVLRT